jgi:hypothetical protein
MKKTAQKKVLKRDVVEHEGKVSLILNSLLKKLGLGFNIIIQPMSENQYTREHKTSRFAIERSNRGLEDKATFNLYFNPSILKNDAVPLNVIKKDIFHELLNAMTWSLTDELESAIDHLKSPSLKKEFQKRMTDSRENTVYLLERKLGKFILPECDWNHDE